MIDSNGRNTPLVNPYNSRKLNVDPALARDGDEGARIREDNKQAKKARKSNDAYRKSAAAVIKVTRNNRHREVTNNYDSRRMKIANGIVAAFVALGIANLPGFVNKVQTVESNYAAVAATEANGKDIVTEAITGRDGTRPVYNYKEIANSVLESDNFDDALYGAYIGFNSKIHGGSYFKISETDQLPDEETLLRDEMDHVLSFTNFETFSTYLRTRGYDNIKEYEDDMKQRIMKENELENMRNELDDMSEKHPFTNSNGGRSL